MEIFQNLKEKPDVGTLLLALQRTIEFEEELAEKFGGSGDTKKVTSSVKESDIGEESNQIVMDIRRKYEKKLVAHQGNHDDDKDAYKDLAVPGAGVRF
ncbi:putative vacuolar protein sorting-associated protein [Helianthus anomalus]